MRGLRIDLYPRIEALRGAVEPKARSVSHGDDLNRHEPGADQRSLQRGPLTHSFTGQIPPVIPYSLTLPSTSPSM